MRRLVRMALAGVAVVGSTLAPVGVSTATAAEVPTHAIVVCQTASFYENYNSSTGPNHLLRTLTYGNKVGHTRGVHPVYNGWAAAQDFGPNDWGFLRIECIGGYNSW